MQGAALGHLMYLGGLAAVVALRYGALLKEFRSTPAAQPGVLPVLFAFVALADYAASLWVERFMRGRGPQQQAAIPVLTAAFGVTIAIYGMIAWLFGASEGWFWFFVGLAAVHWFHSAVRWQG
jgi:branched-subunit amino acid ABC-type transport system permease component